MAQHDAPAPDDDLPHRTLRTFGAGLRDLSRARHIDEVLQLSVDLAAGIIDGVDYADIMILRDGEIEIPVANHPAAVEIDRAQQETGQGPCLDAMRDGDTVVVHDLRDDDRWPAFTPRALQLGVRSVAAYRVFRGRDGDGTLGALNLFGTQPNRDDLAIELGEVFATYCSTVLGAEIDRQGLQAALRSRDLIGQAKGMLMERHRLTADEAFDRLRRASNDRNVKVRDLAEHVIRAGDLPG